MAIRWIRHDVITSCTQRTSERRFFFKPTAAIRELIGVSAARAQKLFPVKLYWLEVNVNHLHYGIAPIDDTPDAVTYYVRFRQLFNRLVADGVNRLWGRRGAVFGAPASEVHCLDNESVHECFYYAITNPSKDGLCDRVADWEGFSSYPYLAQGKAAEFYYIDRAAWHRAGGERSKVSIDVFEKKETLVFTPLPGTEELSASERRSRIIAEVCVRESRFRAQRRKAGRSAMDKNARARIDPLSAPRKLTRNTPRPLCHTVSKELYEKYEKEAKKFGQKYYAASRKYLSGYFHTAFPLGSIRPPLIRSAVPDSQERRAA
jgi:hypothetical protein